MKSKIQGALLGVMLGDSLGMPVETMTGSEIVRALGPNGVTGFMDPKQTRIDDTKDMRAGDTTDDWQGNKIVLDSLIAQKTYDADHMIGAHCVGMQESTFGWGKGSVRSIQMIVDGKRSGHIAPAKEKGTGLGNGVMMKIPALALYHALQNQKRSHDVRDFDWKLFGKHVRQLGAITHSDERAWIAAYAAGMLIVGALYDLYKAQDRILFWAIEISHHVEQFEELCVPSPQDRVMSGRFYDAAMTCNSGESAVEKFGSGFTVLETLPFVTATFLRHPTDFRAGVLEAVNAGGDTDTNAAIVGALIGATVGVEGIPVEWRTFRPEFEEAIVLGEQLYNLLA